MNSSSDPGGDTSTWDSTLKIFRDWVLNPSNRAMAVFLLVGVIVVSVELLHIPVLSDTLSELELRNQDQFFEWRDQLFGHTQRIAEAQNSILLVRIDKESRRRLGLPEKGRCPYQLYAALIKKLHQAGAELIALDVPLSANTASSQSTKELDHYLRTLKLSDSSNNESDSISPSATDPAVRALASEISAAKNVIAACRGDIARIQGERRSELGTRIGAGTGARTDARLDLRTDVRTDVGWNDSSTAGDYNAPEPALLAALGPDRGTVGNAEIVLDSDGTVRRANLTFDDLRPSNIFFKSFSLRIAEHSLGTDAVTEENGEIFFRNRLFPRKYRINYVGPPHTFPMVPIWRALDWERHHARHGLFAPEPTDDPQLQLDGGSTANEAQPAERLTNNDSDSTNPFKGKIVLVGYFDEDSVSPSYSSSATGTYLTPASDDGQLTSDLELQANLTANVMAGDFLTEPQGWEYLLIIALVSLLFGRILSLCGDHLIIYTAILAGLTALWMLAAFYAFLSLHLLIPSVVPNLAVALPSSIIVLVDHYIVRRQERISQTRLFRSLAAKPMAQEIERKLLAELGLDGKRATVTVLALQLNEFPKHVNDRLPEEIFEELNACLAVAMRSIGEHSGVVERIWNCGVIGLFGAPIAMSLEEQAKKAVDCLVDIKETLKTMPGAEVALNAESPFELRCGISTGEAVCGTLNASSRDSVLMQYGAIGPAVELAIDLERLNSTYGTVCIISQTTADLLVGRAELREVDRRILGINNGEQSVFEFLASRGSLPAVFEEAMAIFQQARQAYEDGRTTAAHELFSTVNEMVPEDRPTIMMLRRCDELLQPETSTDPVE